MSASWPLNFRRAFSIGRRPDRSESVAPLRAYLHVLTVSVAETATCIVAIFAIGPSDRIYLFGVALPLLLASCVPLMVWLTRMPLAAVNSVTFLGTLGLAWWGAVRGDPDISHRGAMMLLTVVLSLLAMPKRYATGDAFQRRFVPWLVAMGLLKFGMLRVWPWRYLGPPIVLVLTLGLIAFFALAIIRGYARRLAQLPETDYDATQLLEQIPWRLLRRASLRWLPVQLTALAVGSAWFVAASLLLPRADLDIWPARSMTEMGAVVVGSLAGPMILCYWRGLPVGRFLVLAIRAWPEALAVHLGHTSRGSIRRYTLRTVVLITTITEARERYLVFDRNGSPQGCLRALHFYERSRESRELLERVSELKDSRLPMIVTCQEEHARIGVLYRSTNNCSRERYHS